MSNQYYEYANAINQIFETQFNAVYKICNKKRRAKLLPFIANIYRRWYYSSLIEDTLLTPANLFESLNLEYEKPSGSSPIPTLRSPRSYTGMQFFFRDYTLEHHPVVDDFRRLIAFCVPDITLNDADSPDDDLLARATEALQLWDPHYITYLLGVALELKLLRKMPSLYTNRAYVVPNYAENLSVPDEHLFRDIVAATVRIAADTLTELVQLPGDLFNEHFLWSLLRKPMNTDDIFQRVYDSMGVNLNDIFDMDFDDGYMGLDAAVISGTFMLGITMDKFFFTPFSHYLKLIRPIYALPFDLENEIQMLAEANFEGDDLYTAFFAPCSQYFLTDLGLTFFAVKPNRRNYINIRIMLPFMPIFQQFVAHTAQEPQTRPHTQAVPDTAAGVVYELKVKSIAQGTLWLNMEADADTTLHRLFLEISLYFNLAQYTAYSFFQDLTESPFSEYPSPKSPHPVKKADEITLASLALPEKHVLLLAVYNRRTPHTASNDRESRRLPKNAIRLSVAMVRTKAKSPRRIYPAVIRVSKALRYTDWQDE